MESIFKTSKINYLTPENAQFSKTEGGLLYCKWVESEQQKAKRKEDEKKFAKDKASKKSDKGADKAKDECDKPEGVVKLHRAFPFVTPTEYISVFKDDDEVGIIKDIMLFDETTRQLLGAELKRVYFSPIITKINTIKERYGFSYWEVTTDKGKLDFAVADTYRNIIKLGKNRLKIIDQDANRYEISDYTKLDKGSIKMLEMYI
ncbi:MAG: DUF1854 domain-containing protein [Firmicutes bacterium]|nr:DUF1854 domain-containing protein [Bacillota bacterium]